MAFGRMRSLRGKESGLALSAGMFNEANQGRSANDTDACVG